VLPDTALDNARLIIERVRHASASAAIVGIEGQSVAATLSAGVAQRPEATASAVEFVNQASKALLEAKGAGRNRVALTG
jgi:PleD family two-component response regulator